VRARLVVTLVAVAALVAGCGGAGRSDEALSTPPVKGATEVGMKGLRFNPPVIEITPGTTVTWKFDDGSIPHNVKAVDGAFTSPTTEKGTFTHTFGTAGTFDYKCDLHPGMSGRIIVRDNG
jgi:plastocyanin